MIIIFFLVPFSFLFLFFAIYFFWWAVDNDQFENLSDVSESILISDDFFDR